MGPRQHERAFDFRQYPMGLHLFLAAQLSHETELPRPTLLGLGHGLGCSVEGSLNPEDRHDGFRRAERVVSSVRPNLAQATTTKAWAASSKAAVSSFS
ncbi:hypothetical protein [Methylobacterium nigriterrae]|uniref:hypothetical protein n=1 Tax=Methylobacterium nigriterrae TaxID=3127512 RepID=UPI003013793A